MTSPALRARELEPGNAELWMDARWGSPGSGAREDPGPAPRPYDPKQTDQDQDTGDVSSGVDEDELDHDDLDTDRVTSTEARSAAVRSTSMLVRAGGAPSAV